MKRNNNREREREGETSYADKDTSMAKFQVTDSHSILGICQKEKKRKERRKVAALPYAPTLSSLFY